MSTLNHDLTKTDDKRYQCTVCGATWKSKPSTNCPGVHRYDYGEVLNYFYADFIKYCIRRYECYCWITHKYVSRVFLVQYLFEMAP